METHRMLRCHPLRALALGAFLFGAAAAAPASAAPIITLTVSGTITAGTDHAGKFFAPGTDLTGKGFTLVTTFNPTGTSVSGTSTEGTVTAFGPGAPTQITIAGGSAPFSAVGGFGVFTSGIGGGGTLTGVDSFVFGAQGGIDLGGTYVSLLQTIAGVLADATALQSFSLTGPFFDPDDSFAEVRADAYSNDGINTPVLLFSFAVQGSEVELLSVQVTEVPEPAGLAVLAIAAAGLVAVRRRAAV
ncbi:PEP-CTERM sorting domain-containing protein [Falsiroseomonas bella]|uniref:PEP-CTERM sorting domain-containing protein n=1 Tax=Falsiroseomonas bella TaxID=2184016 RepID=UPI001304A29A|nr:PEP-CTERM sorting domain-containing protein [Falsiroseomonas bella]